MKVFLIQLLSITFVLLITGSIQSVTADHLEPGQGIFKNEREIEAVPIQDSNYQIYLQTVLRNVDDQMISVAEGMHGFVIPHQVTDHVFDMLMGKKEIVTIDNIKYEKVQYTFSPTLEQRTEKTYPIFEEFPIEYVVEEDARVQMNEDIRDYYRWVIHYCATFEGHVYTCIPVFQAFTVVELVTPTDVVTHQWTILRVLN
jgi:Fe-S cluster assembly scaffold protein SufB